MISAKAVWRVLKRSEIRSAIEEYGERAVLLDLGIDACMVKDGSPAFPASIRYSVVLPYAEALAVYRTIVKLAALDGDGKRRFAQRLSEVVAEFDREEGDGR